MTRQQTMRVMLGVGTALVLASIALPYWTVRVRAPQYPKGLVLVVYPHRLGGDVREMDMLNHYIGMRSLEHGAAMERRLAIPGIIFTGLCLLLAAWLRRRWTAWLMLPALALPLLFVADLYWWMREFGLNLDPRAPLSRAIKPFVPPLLGDGRIAQFQATAHFTAGFYCVLAAAALALAALILRRSGARPPTLRAAVVAVSLLCAGLWAPTASAATLAVGAHGSYATIGAALAAASPGDTILVQSGTWSGPLVVDKTVALLGEGAPVIDGGGRGTVVRLAAPGIVLRGFAIRHSGDVLSAEDTGILVSAPDVTVEANQLEDVLFGISLARAPRAVVRGNRLRGKRLPMGRRGDLIRVWYSDHVALERNEIEDGRDVVLWFSKQLTVRENSIRRGRYGVHFMYCDDATVEDNRLTGNSVGVYLMYSARLRLAHNRITDNRGPSGYGVGFKDMQQTRIEDNIIADNRVGLFLDNAESLLRENVVAYNDIGVALLPSAQHNEMLGNSFIENGDQVAIDGFAAMAANRWHGNFWSDYRGYDADADGRGDRPYEAVQLFERLTDRYPALRLYSGSPAVRTLEFAARLFPVFAPQPMLVDDAPRLTPRVPSLHLLAPPEAFP